MQIRPFSAKFPITITRSTLVNILLMTNAFVWYYYAIDILQKIMEAISLDYFTNLAIWSTHFAALIFSALVGVFLTNRLGGRNRFLIIWMALGIASPLASLAINITDISGAISISLALGISLGLGMPNCMGYYTRHVSVESRGRLGGLIILFTGMGMIGLGSAAIDNVVMQMVVLAIWRAFGLAVFILFKPHEEIKENNRVPSYRKIIGQRPFILYFVPWVMFSLVNYLTTPVLNIVFEADVIRTLIIIENGLIGICAIIGGFLLDTIGRKRMAIIGFVMLGLSYAVLGTSPKNPYSWYFHTVVDGIAWGILLVIFVVTIWGDLSHSTPSDKYYAVGVFPFFISKFLQLTAGDQIITIIPDYAIFSFTAFFLFLAVLPLVYAPETLPEKLMKDRELKNYIDKAQKEVEKAQKKEAENAPKENTDAEVEFEGEDFEEKLKEAEKYY